MKVERQDYAQVEFPIRHHRPSWKAYGQGGSHADIEITRQGVRLIVHEFAIGEKRDHVKEAWTNLTVCEAITLRDMLNTVVTNEAAIISTLLETILSNGCVDGVQVINEDGDKSGTTRNRRGVWHFMDQYYGGFRIDALDHDANVLGWVSLIPGNGTAVISDYSTTIEHLVDPAKELAELIDESAAP